MEPATVAWGHTTVQCIDMEPVKRWIQPGPEVGTGCESIGLWLTNACNLNCTYCYIKHKSEATMTLETAQRIITTVLNSPGGRVLICFMGAEPLTRFELMREIVEWTKSVKWLRAFSFMAATNGTLLKEEMKPWLYENRSLLSLGLSLDGDTISQRQNRGKTVQELDFFLQTWPKQPMKMTISEESVQRLCSDIVYLHSIGAAFTANAAYEEMAWDDISIRCYQKQLLALADYYIENPSVLPCNIFSPVPERMLCSSEQKQLCYCSAGSSFEFYDMDGVSYPCHMLSPMVLEETHSREACKKKIDQDGDFRDPACEKCALRRSCYTCLGSNELYRGDFRRRDPLHCQLYQAQVKAQMHLWIGRYQTKTVFTKKEKERLKAMTQIWHCFDNGQIGMQ